MTTHLPHGWIWASPAELASQEKHALGIGPFGSDLKVTDYTDGGVPLVFVRNIRAGNFLLANQPTVSPEKAAQLLAHRVVPGDVLITKMGEPPGDAAVYPEHAPEGRMTADCIRLRVNVNVATAKFVMYATHSPVVKDQILSETKGVAQKKISLERFRTVRYPLPALPDQHRIVAAIETHFSRLDAAVASLIRAKANVKRARASVLKAAVEGRLVPTEAALARTEGRDYEPASTLLARILAERQAAWTASGTKGKYKEPIAPATEGSPELPEGWCWTTPDQVAARVTVGHVGSMKSRYCESGVPFLRSQNVRPNRFDWGGLLSIPLEFHAELEKSKVVPGDVLVVRSGSVGTACVLPEAVGEANCSDLVLVKRPRVEPNYLAYYINAGATAEIERGKVGVALTHFNTASVAALRVAIPPMAEQHRIVAEIDRRLSVLDALDTTLDANLARCAKLRQSILKRAFEGKLVPAEDPHNHTPSATRATRAPQRPLFEGATG